MRHRIVSCLVLVLLLGTAARAAKHATVTAALNVSALQPGKTAVIAVITDVNSGLHAQSSKPLDQNLFPFSVTTDANAAVEFQPPIYPAGRMTSMLGQPISAYIGRTITFIPIAVKPDAPPGPIHLSGVVSLQACSDLTTTCFLPERIPFAIDSQITSADQSVTPVNSELFKSLNVTQPTTQPATAPTMVVPNGPPPSMTDVSLFGHTFDLKDAPAPVIGLIAFFAGMIFNIVPCVLPVLPLKAIGFFEASQHNRARTLLLGFVFSCGLVSVFAALGIVILASKAIIGHQITWGQWFGYPVFVWGVALLLTGLGVGMLGAFSVRLPTSVYGVDFRHDTLSGNFMWGILTAILSTPCTAPLFPAVLGVSLLLPKFVGVLLVITVGVGMAFPYFFLSAFPELARRFPRTGAASELVKQMMGFLMLGSAAFFAGLEVVGQPNQWWIVFAVVVWACLYMVIRTPQITKKSGPICVVTGLAVALTGGALVLTLNLTDALAAWSNAAPVGVEWQPYTADTFSQARSSNHVVLVDFTANWCLNCKFVETTVYRDKRALDAIKQDGVVTIKADLSTHDEPGNELYDRLGITGIPYTAIFFPNDPKPVGLASIYTTDQLLAVLARAAPASAEANAGAK